MVDCQDNVLSARVNENMGNFVDEVHNRDVGVVSSPKRDVTMFEGDTDFEPRNGIEFESHEAAYSFYQEYAKSMGFTTSIKNSRRSKKSKEFIDAKFACSRYGVTPESDSGSSRRPSVKKTDCKASMHVKRRADGKWIIHEFIKEHNHELLPALAYHFRIHRNVKLAEKNNIDILHAVSERTRKIAIELSEEGSLSEESYSISFRALVEALKNCVNVNNITFSAAESSGNALVLREEEESRGSLGAKTSKKKSTYKKRKVPAEPDVLLVEPQDSLQQMDNLSSDGMTLTGYYGAQQNVQGLLNLMEPPHDGYYVNQHSIQGLGQLNSIAPSHDGFFGTQQSIHGLGQLDFRPPANFSYSLQLQDEPHLRTTQLHGSASRQA
ncbi:hypothetical protein CMV_028187 [Castanea mollissima]|uniref:FAR1 domain-containing protein n=1 Tax=Castanea mollissima TaxID=60419 RepID=A0A8J4QGR4_9ROSI|nr:hypothetical protein CMV_028187 [Castanea mollissima]